MKQLYNILIITFTFSLFLPNVNALSVRGGITYFNEVDGQSVPSRVLALSASQTSESGEAEGKQTFQGLESNTRLFTEIECLIEKRPGLLVAYGSLDPKSITTNESPKTLAVILDRGRSQPDAITSFFEEDLGGCEDIQAIVDAISEEELTFFATFYETELGLIPVGNLQIKP